MRSAPSVIYPVGNSRNARLLNTFVWLMGVGCGLAACAWRNDTDWRVGLLVLSVLVASGGVWQGLRQSAWVAELSFDGRHWSMAGRTAMRGAGIRVALDFQSLMLVRLAGARRPPCWVWLDERSKPDRWKDLRRAVYSRAPSDIPVAEPRRSTASDLPPSLQ